MLIGEAQHRAAEAARSVKQQHLARIKRGENSDILTFIEGYRGDEVIVVATLPPDRDSMLQAMDLIAGGFSVDVIATSMETFHTESPTNPLTGESWGPGEMQQAANEHDGITKGWISEALVTTVANRAGDMVQVIQPYTLKPLGKRVTISWGKPHSTLDEGVELQGLVPDAIQQIMDKPTLDVVVSQSGFNMADFGLSPEVARAHQDIASLRVLKERLGDRLVTIMLPIEPNTARGEVLLRRLREMEQE